MTRVSVIEALEALDLQLPAGVEGKIPCPVHGDPTASLHVYREPRGWWCFACGVGGDAIDLVRFVTGANFPTAKAFLAGLVDELDGDIDLEARPERREVKEHDFTWELLNEASRTTGPQWAEAAAYVLGTWPHLSLWQLTEWGVQVGPYNFMIPHLNADGVVVGVKTRSFVGGNKGRKAAFPGSTYPELYRVRTASKDRHAIVVEGESDTWTMTLRHPDCAVYGLPSGAKALRPAYVRTLLSHPMVFVALDADPTGDEAAEKLLDQLGDHPKSRMRPVGYKDWTEVAVHQFTAVTP